jgi:GNAT superfamily N-acetyltransferase
MAGGVIIRRFESDDADRVDDLLDVLAPAKLVTGDLLRYRQASEPERARHGRWVAAQGADILGYASAYFSWFGGESGRGRIWLGVSEAHRSRGIGTALWELAVEHLRDARKLTVEVDDDPAGLGFVERRGFTQYDAEVISVLRPPRTELEPKPHGGFEVVQLRDAAGREQELYEFYRTSGGIQPGDPENRVSFHEWRRFIFASPLLDDETSALVLDREGRVVSLSWLLVDRRRQRALNEWTATLPSHRSRGLARLAKIASIRWAAGAGITEILTGNDPDNLPMRELNRRLGYRELFTRRDMEKVVAPAPEAPAP